MNSSVIGIIFDDKLDKVLLVKRRDIPIWVLPGGGVDENETPQQAVIREVLEETGLNVSIKRLVGIYKPINRLSKTTYVMECMFLSGKLTTGDETLSVDFFAIEHLPTPFFFLHEDWLNDAKKQLSEPIEKTLNQITYWNFFKYLLINPLQVIRLLLSRVGMPINSSSNKRKK